MPTINASESPMEKRIFEGLSVVHESIAAAIEFLAKYIGVSFLMLFHPATVGRKLTRPEDSLYKTAPRPYTYLATSFFLLIIAIRGAVQFARELFAVDDPSELLTPIIRRELATVDTLTLIKYGLPVVFIVIGGARLVSRSVSLRGNEVKRGEAVACYLAAFQCMGLCTVILSYLMLGEKVGDSGYFVLGVFCYTLLVYFWLIPGVILSLAFREIAPTFLERWKVLKISGVVGYTLMLPILPLLVAGGELAVEKFFQPPPFEFRVGKVARAKEKKSLIFRYTIALQNMSDEVVYVERGGMTSDIKFDCKGKRAELTSLSGLRVERWSGGDAPVLIVGPKESAWMQLKDDFGEGNAEETCLDEVEEADFAFGFDVLRKGRDQTEALFGNEGVIETGWISQELEDP